MASRLRSRLRAVRSIALACVLALPPGARAQSLDGLTDQQVKVAFVYNFAKFVEWPGDAFASPQSPIVVCLPPQATASAASATIEGRRAQGREVRVRRDVRPDELHGCHILYVATADGRIAEGQIRSAMGLPLLTVGESVGFAGSGGMIGFVARDERVHFEINPDAAQRAGLRISAQLLRLAILVRDSSRSKP